MLDFVEDVVALPDEGHFFPVTLLEAHGRGTGCCQNTRCDDLIIGARETIRAQERNKLERPTRIVAGVCGGLGAISSRWMT